MFKHGNYIKYTRRMIKENGSDFVDNLIEMGKELHQFTLEELIEIGRTYKQKVLAMPNYESG